MGAAVARAGHASDEGPAVLLERGKLVGFDVVVLPFVGHAPLPGRGSSLGIPITLRTDIFMMRATVGATCLLGRATPVFQFEIRLPGIPASINFFRIPGVIGKPSIGSTSLKGDTMASSGHLSSVLCEGKNK